MMSDELLDTICGVEPEKIIDAESASEMMREAMRSATIAQEEIVSRYRAGLFLSTVVVDSELVSKWSDPRFKIKPIDHPGPLLNGC